MIIIFCLGLFSFLLEPVYYVSETPGAENSVRVVLAFKILVLTPLIIISFVLHPRLTGKLSDGSPEDISPAAFHLHIAFTVVALIHWSVSSIPETPVTSLLTYAEGSSTWFSSSTSPRTIRPYSNTLQVTLPPQLLLQGLLCRRPLRKTERYQGYPKSLSPCRSHS
jgi:hypothetical protein